MKTANRIRAKAKVVNPIRFIVMEPQICGRVVKSMIRCQRSGASSAAGSSLQR